MSVDLNEIVWSPLTAAEFASVVITLRPIEQFTREMDGSEWAVSVLDDIPTKTGIAICLIDGDVTFWKWSQREDVCG